jgi:hypothetical protein
MPLPGLTVMDTLSLPDSPAASLAVAVTSCEPGLNTAVEKLPPAPIWPSILETQTIFADRLPCSGPLALAVNEIESPSVKIEPAEGALMSTSGGWFSGFTMVSSVAVLFPPSGSGSIPATVAWWVRLPLSAASTVTV